MDHIQQQSGVIPYRVVKGRLTILLITSRRGKRWIIPKGFIETDMDAATSAEKEAYEEAGVTGKLSKKLVGQYRYHKWSQDFEVAVYPLEVLRELVDWPEADSRARQWLSLQAACELVSPPPLKEILRTFPSYLCK